jgi:hypothetical protein
LALFRNTRFCRRLDNVKEEAAVMAGKHGDVGGMTQPDIASMGGMMNYG